MLEQNHRWDNSEMQPPIPPPQQQGPYPGPPNYGPPGYGPPGYGPQGYGPQGGGPLTAEEKNWAMGCHLAGFALYLLPGIGQILGPLIVWLLKKDSSSFIDYHGKEALNYNISLTIYWIIAGAVSVFLFITLIGIPLAILILAALPIVDIVLRIMDAVKASNGEQVSNPLSIRFLR